MKKTPFTDIHISLGAKMHEFAGYNMPIEYSGITDEHLTVRNAVGVFDVSHMGEIWVKGEKALALLQTVTTNDVTKIRIGQAQYTCMPNGKGGIVDDILIYHFEPQKYMLVVNASNIDKDWNWLHTQNTMGAELQNASEHTAQLAVQGVKATELLQKLTPVDLSKIPYYHFEVGEFAQVPNVIISNTGYTGAGGFELYFYPEYGEKIWNALFEIGEPMGLKPIGLGARDTLRLEKGFCLYGNDIDDTTSPIEAGLGWITKFVDNKDFIDRPYLEKQKQEGVKKKLIKFETTQRGIPRTGYDMVNATDEVIGRVTSGTMLPDTKKCIGMAYLDAPYFVGTGDVFVKIRNKNIPIKIVK